MMCRLPIKRLSKVQNFFVELRHCIFGHVWGQANVGGHSVLQTPALVMVLTWFPVTSSWNPACYIQGLITELAEEFRMGVMSEN